MPTNPPRGANIYTPSRTSAQFSTCLSHGDVRAECCFTNALGPHTYPVQNYMCIGEGHGHCDDYNRGAIEVCAIS